MKHREKGDKVRVDRALAQTQAENYDAIVLPGGGLLRIGQGLAVDWAQPRIAPALSDSDAVNRSAIAGRWGAWYLFGGIEGRAIARNIFLDGNSFEQSAHVTKRPLVADFTGGLMTYLWAARFSVSYTRRSREFTTQLKQDEFVSVLLAVNF